MLLSHTACLRRRKLSIKRFPTLRVEEVRPVRKLKLPPRIAANGFVLPIRIARKISGGDFLQNQSIHRLKGMGGISLDNNHVSRTELLLFVLNLDSHVA